MSYCVHGFSCHSLSPFNSIINRFGQVFQTKPCVRAELFQLGSFWSSNTCTSMQRGPSENVTHEFVFASPTVSRMSCPSYVDSFEMWSRWPYSYCFIGCCFYSLFNVPCSILGQLLSSFFYTLSHRTSDISEVHSLLWCMTKYDRTHITIDIDSHCVPNFMWLASN